MLVVVVMFVVSREFVIVRELSADHCSSLSQRLHWSSFVCYITLTSVGGITTNFIPTLRRFVAGVEVSLLQLLL